jgi:hypothetical protein
MLANTFCTSPTSANTGVHMRTSSSKRRELLRRLDSRRGRFAGVGTRGGVTARDELRVGGSSRDGGGGGSCIVSGDGCTIGIRSYCTRYRCKASSGSVVKSICRRVMPLTRLTDADGCLGGMIDTKLLHSPRGVLHSAFPVQAEKGLAPWVQPFFFCVVHFPFCPPPVA